MAKTTTGATTGNRYLYRRSTGDFIALGERRSDGNYHNYGVNISSVSGTANEHVWKMENRIAADGSNMIYLFMDGTELGAMNRYYINGTAQNKTDNWVAGKNFTFGYFGTDSHPLSNVNIDYIKVWEAGVPNAADLPKNFHWKYDAQSDSMVNVTDSTFSANSLTMTHGSVADGQLAGGRFTLGETVDLDHDQPWVIEWKSKGNWTDTTDGALLFAEANNSQTKGASYFYRRSNNQFFAIGHYDGSYQNYAALLTGIDATAEHVWRLENRISQDGSNMVYLCVDGNDVGAMNHYYKGGTYQNKTDSWVSGQDFDFKYMGTTPHTIGGCSIDYIKVWEAGVADKRALEEEVNAAKKLVEDDYTAATWEAVETALAAAEAVLADDDAEQTAVDAAQKALADAVAALVERGDKTELQKAVDDAKALTEADYTTATWAEVEEALADAEEVLADVDALQPAIDAAKKALTDAVAALVERGDKTELQKAVDDAKALTEADYTTATWAEVEEALADAEEVLADVDALQPAIDAAKKALTDAVAALVERGDKTALQKAVDDAKALTEADYTTATWADVEEALADAEAVLADVDALQPAIDAAKKALDDAVAALVKRGDKTELAKAVKAATALDKDDYTADTWAAVEDALADAEAVLAEEDALQRDVDAAEKALEDAVAALKKPATSPETGDNAPIVLWTILLCLSATAVVVLKKKERELAE